ncbi:diguanylate cyclase [Vibrio kyushuensis]|uniref:CHASE3 domain-containing protein n=1 Tax=Vibrio kyushuensis TaxID=2910249 RepID=UPI003D0F8D07
MSVRLKLTIILFILFAASIGNSILFYFLESHSDDRVRWVNHTNSVIYHSQLLLSAMKDAETGQRGFLLTINPEYLEPYHVGRIEALGEVHRLKKLTSNNPEQKERIDEVTNHITLKFDELAETIKRADEGNIADAINMVRQNNGKIHMGKIRLIMAEFVQFEESLLEERRKRLDELDGYIKLIQVIEIVFFTLFSIITYVFVHDRLFAPLKVLLANTEKMKKGEMLSISDHVPKDEMGVLLSSFYSMSSQVHERAERLHYESIHDGLTGLKDRKTLDNEILEEVAHSRVTESKLALFYIDLNKFKPINDEYGHEVGDVVLIEVGRRLTSAVRSNDSVFRVGGDEFVILVKQINMESEIELVVQKIISAFEPKFVAKDLLLDITLSIGVSISPDHSHDGQSLIHYADVAMFEAKKANGCDYVIYTPPA